jgi:hypothetical protein
MDKQDEDKNFDILAVHVLLVAEYQAVIRQQFIDTREQLEL